MTICVYDRVEYCYDRLGEKVGKTDQNGTVHVYDYDGLGRLCSDSVSAFGQGVHSGVGKITRSYEVRGLPALITSYDGQKNVVNQVSLTYDDMGLPVTCLSDVGLGMDETRLVDYHRFGVQTIVQTTYLEPQLRCDLAHGAGDDPYAGLDQFGRIADLRWWNTATGEDVERVRHGYDRSGNRLWRECPVAASVGKHFDELYACDGVDQLVSMQRGDLNAEKTGLVPTTKNFAESWSLDMTGNWREYPSVETAIPSVELSVGAYLVKPLDFDELRRHIECAIAHSQDHRAGFRQPFRSGCRGGVPAALRHDPRPPEAGSRALPSRFGGQFVFARESAGRYPLSPAVKQTSDRLSTITAPSPGAAGPFRSG